MNHRILYRSAYRTRRRTLRWHRNLSAKAISEVIQERVGSGALQHDPIQLATARRLDRLQQALDGYTNLPIMQWQEKRQRQERTLQERQLSADMTISETDETHESAKSKHDKIVSPPLPRIPRGLYIHGPVGSGKSMLMNTFYQQLLQQGTKRRIQRMHFHAFLHDVHQRIHTLKQLDLRLQPRPNNNFSADTSYNPVLRVSRQLASECDVLCLDEFQVTDVADALVLSQLYTGLFQSGTVLIATSNRPPEDLYEGGLHRERYFMPFVELLRKHCIVHSMEKSAVDYRTLMSQQQEGDQDSMFLVGMTDGDMEDCSNIIHHFIEVFRAGAESTSIELKVGFERKLTVRDADSEGLVGRFDFYELCGRDLGAQDFRAIAQHFGIVVVENIPELTLDGHNQARRFVTFIDELYEARTALLCTAVAPPDLLFIDTPHVSDVKTDSPTGDIEFGIDQAISRGHSVGALASVRELSFAFRRAASRLTEMTSRRWWDLVLDSNRSIDVAT